MTNNYRRILWIAMAMLALSAASYAQIGVGIAVSFGPPPLPVYEQPLCPGDGYLWTPGYWDYDYDDGDYYWVPGTWIMARQSACSGPQDGGDGKVGDFSSTRATGDRRSVSMAELITVMDTSAKVIKADAGTTTDFSTIGPSIT